MNFEQEWPFQKNILYETQDSFGNYQNFDILPYGNLLLDLHTMFYITSQFRDQFGRLIQI